MKLSVKRNIISFRISWSSKKVNSVKIYAWIMSQVQEVNNWQEVTIVGKLVRQYMWILKESCRYHIVKFFHGFGYLRSELVTLLIINKQNIWLRGNQTWFTMSLTLSHTNLTKVSTQFKRHKYLCFWRYSSGLHLISHSTLYVTYSSTNINYYHFIFKFKSNCHHDISSNTQCTVMIALNPSP